MGAVRVVHLCDYASPYPGSFVPGLAAVRDALDTRGWNFEAVFAAGAEQREWYAAARDAGMRVRACPRSARRGRYGWLAELLAERPGPLILHTHFAGWDLPALAVARRPRRRDPVAVVWHRHGSLSRRPWPLTRDILRYGLAGRAVDAHLCVGPGGRPQLLARGAPRRRTLLFPNAIEIGRFPVAEAPERARARAELGIGSEVELLVGFMWEWERKGGPLLLAVVRELVSRGRRVQVLTVGGGERARADADRLGVSRYVTDLAPRSDPRVLFAAADVFMAPSRAEAFGFAPHEAVCCGTPVVASNVSGHRYHGVHLPAMSLTELGVAAIAEAVETELAADSGDRIARIAASRDYIARHLGLEAWVERLLHVYNDVLMRRDARALAST